jgi:purine-binding chemotaxis protein CheW
MSAAPASSSLLVYRAANRRLAIPAGQVREIDRPRRLTTVPNAPASLLGLINLRGSVLPVVSMAGLLGKAPGKASGRGGRIIVVDGARPIGLAVDGVEAVVASGEAKGAEVIDLGSLVTKRFADLASRPAARGERVRAVARRETRAAGVALATFQVSGQDFALPLADIAEVLPLPAEIARVPHAEAVVIGTADGRGGLLPILSLAALLALPDADAARRRVIVVRIGTHQVGLVVDTMRDVVLADPSQIDPLPPILLREQGEARIAAIARLEDGRRLVSVLAADRLVDEALTATLLESAEAGSAAPAERAEATRSILLFKLGGERFGLPLEAVDEVRRLPGELTRLPRAPAFVRGVMNMRDRAVPVIDQGERFGTASGARRHLIVASAGALQAAFLVEAVLGVVAVAESALADMPALGGGRALDRVVDLADGESLALIFSPFELLAQTEREMLAAFRTKAPARP